MYVRPFCSWLKINLCGAKLNIILREEAQNRGLGTIYLKTQQNQELTINKRNLLKPERDPCTRHQSYLCSCSTITKLTCLYIREFKKGESPANTTVLQGMWMPRAKVPVAATTWRINKTCKVSLYLERLGTSSPKYTTWGDVHVAEYRNGILHFICYNSFQFVFLLFERLKT